MEAFTVDSLTNAILRGWKSEGFTDVGYLEKFARGIAKGVYEEITEHTVRIIDKDNPKDPPPIVYTVFDPNS